MRATPKNPSRDEAFQKVFSEIWSLLFSTPVHLDSALSKQKPQWKSLLAQIVPPILLRPASMAQAMGIGVPEGEPWKLTSEELAHWPTAAQLADRIKEGLQSGIFRSDPIEEDFPPAMLAEWKQDWGNEIAAALVQGLAKEAPLALRANRSISPDQLIQELKKEKALPVRAEVSSLSPQGVRIDGYARVLSTQAFERGAFEIQDEGSQILAYFALAPEAFGSLLTPHPGSSALNGARLSLPKLGALTVIDACAGAGGKTLAIADALGGRGRVYAYDTSDKKLQALKRRAKRAECNNVQAVRVTDGHESEVTSKFEQTADIVLVDAPCSGWGVLRRNPDIKWRQSPATLRKMPELQLRILSEYAKLVKPGGRLVYGLCTFRKPESLGVVDAFIEAHPAFQRGPGGFLGPGPSDGFFMQAFDRT